MSCYLGLDASVRMTASACSMLGSVFSERKLPTDPKAIANYLDARSQREVGIALPRQWLGPNREVSTWRIADRRHLLIKYALRCASCLLFGQWRLWSAVSQLQCDELTARSSGRRRPGLYGEHRGFRRDRNGGRGASSSGCPT
jgi:hypothetical protein